jgi:hypothetical protein
VKLVPAPPNDFLDFMRAYYTRCRARVPQIRAVAAKWAFEDLIPGLSDFDTRFIVADGMTIDDWRRMSLEVGAVHTEMCREHPKWARNLEHLPGINLTIGEATDPRLFYPEFQQWTFYAGDADVIGHVEATLAAVQWSDRDESYHLRRFATFAGPYLRGIDPPVNLGPWTDEYALHSRFMHYFTPPVQSAVSLLLRRNVRGKLESLRMARELIPNGSTIDLLFDVVARHYEVPELYVQPRLSELENELERYLESAWAALRDRVTLVSPAPGDRVDAIRAKVKAVTQPPTNAFFEGAKFGRLLKGRLLFYADTIPHFDSAWLIRNEIGRIVSNFYEKPLGIYGHVRFGNSRTPDEVLSALTGQLLRAADAHGMRRFVQVASPPIEPGLERQRARDVADSYDAVLTVVETLGDDLLAQSAPDQRGVNA